MARLKYIGSASFMFNGAYFNPIDTHPCDLAFISSDWALKHSKPMLEHLLQNSKTQIVGPRRLLQSIRGDPARKLDADIGDTFEVEGYSISVVPAEHRALETTVGFIVTHDNKSVYFTGNTYPFMEMSQFRADCAVLNVTGERSMDELSGLRAAGWIRIKTLIPLGVKERHRFKPPGKTVVFLSPGAEYTLP